MVKTNIIQSNSKEEKGIFEKGEVQEMLEAGLEWGLKSTKVQPKTKAYILGIKNNVSVFDLEKTKKLLDKALDFLGASYKQKRIILFVDTTPVGREKVKEIALEFNCPYVTERWVGGLITNFEEIKRRIDYLKKLREKKEKSNLKELPVKERQDLLKELESLEKKFSGLINLTKLPDIIFLINPPKHKTAVREARKKSIPIVALANVDCDISLIDYPILGNDRARRPINYVLERVKQALKSE